MILRALVLFIVLFVVMGILVILARNQIKDYEAKIQQQEYTITSNQKTIYVAGLDIEAGTKAEPDVNIISTTIASGVDAALYATADDFTDTTIFLVDTYLGQPIMKNMISNEGFSEGDKEVEISTATLLVDSKENDVVDIRIAFPDGSDYCVLSKKQMKQLVYDSSIWYTDLNEQEILTYTSAVIDAFTNTGTYIYITRYTNPTVQEATQCTYPINQIAHDMVNGTGETEDPNIVRTNETYEKMVQTLNTLARSRLEQKLQSLTPEQLAAVAAGRGLQDTAAATAYAGAEAYEAEQAESEDYDDGSTYDYENSSVDSASTDSSSTDSSEEYEYEYETSDNLGSSDTSLTPADESDSSSSVETGTVTSNQN